MTSEQTAILAHLHALRNGHRKPQAHPDDLVKHCGGNYAKLSADLQHLVKENKIQKYGSEFLLVTEQRKAAQIKEKVVRIDSVDSVKLKTENSELKRRLSEALVRQVTDERYEQFIAKITDRPVTIPRWLSTPTKSTGRKVAVPTALYSDQHFDEVVDPKQVNGVNTYNREIGLARNQNFFRRVIKLGKQYIKGVDYDGIVLALGGDTFSGNIHDELKRTNESSLCDAIVYWIGPMVAGIRSLAEAYGSVYVPGVVGNHGRNTVKPISKGRVRDNFDWLFYNLIARELSGDKRITFAISESPDFLYQIYQTRYMLTHGDQFKGGSGIAGLLSPMMLGDARKRKRANAINTPYDYMVMGHWHQFMQAKGVIVNGSLKGYDEYAFNMNFDYEPPQQAFWLTSPERKTIWSVTPIDCRDSKDPDFKHVQTRGDVVPFARLAA